MSVGTDRRCKLVSIDSVTSKNDFFDRIVMRTASKLVRAVSADMAVHSLSQ
jgi:hypothetical protein